MKIGIVADDLTGAADSAAPFADRGMRCCAALCELAGSASAFAEYDVVSVSSETRDIDGSHRDLQSASVTNAVRDLYEIVSPQILCKKIDSTLRGNPAVELTAVSALAPARTPIICPAFPAQGRTVVDGRLYVFGEPAWQVSESFGQVNGKNCVCIHLADIRHGKDWLYTKLMAQASSASSIFFDSETDQDLVTVATVVIRNPERWLPVGSAGFIGTIAEAICPFRIENSRIDEAKRRLTSEPVLVICGSKSRVCRQQISEFECSAGISRVGNVRDAIGMMAAGSRIAIASTPEEEQDRDVVLENLLTGIGDLRKLQGSASLVATGGATVAALLRTWESFSHLDILGEIEPGIVAAVARFRKSGNTHELPVHLVLKAGAFGNLQTLARILGL